jgi:2-polyprenyl-3-methyl-5-hydroxy-6-metoxy-1,4-benzoquinol methylase
VERSLARWAVALEKYANTLTRRHGVERMLTTKESIENGIAELAREFGEWIYDIPLPHDTWTLGNLHLRHTRVRRILQVAKDLCPKPLSECRVLDLGCLEGMFSIEFASHGAQTVGIEIREGNFRKASFCKETLELENVRFIQDDVRNISAAALGTFDIIVCSGILYHLRAQEALDLVTKIFDMSKGLVIVDTHIALRDAEQVSLGGQTYWGMKVGEYPKGATQELKNKMQMAAWINEDSFHFTRPSLVNMLSHAGFSSVYECFSPAHINFGEPGIEHLNRCTFVAVKSEPCEVVTSPAVNGLQENWPEGTLSYSPLTFSPPTLWERVVRSKRLRAALMPWRRVRERKAN